MKITDNKNMCDSSDEERDDIDVREYDKVVCVRQILERTFS